MRLLEEEEVDPLVCEFDQHKWEMEIEEGQVNLRCLDPCEFPEGYVPQQKLPACLMMQDLERDYFQTDGFKSFPVTLSWHYVSGGYEYPEDGECWLQVDPVEAKAERALELLHELVGPDNSPCSFDHNGSCQQHGWFGDKPGECGIREARELLGLDADS